MNATTPNCLLASTAIHAAAFAFLLLAPLILPNSPKVTDSSPVLEIIPDDLKLTDGTTVGGGNPEVKQAPAPAPTRTESPKNVQPVPAPAPKPEPPKVEKKESPPVKQPEPVKNEPKTELAKETKSVKTAAKPVKNPQDVDDTMPAPATAKKAVQLASSTKRRTKNEAEDDKAAKAAADKAEKERQEKAAAEAAAARTAWERAQQARADALRGAANSLGKALAGSTSIEMPGPGGAAYAPYGAYLATFYKLRWKKPSSLNVDRAEVGAQITVTRDGKVKSFRITAPSGIKALDDSVREVLDKNRQLRPLPEGTDDDERTVSIRFDLSASSST
jgi:TonB family protein